MPRYVVERVFEVFSLVELDADDEEHSKAEAERFRFDASNAYTTKMLSANVGWQVKEKEGK